MLNKEKFKDEIFEIACSGQRFAVEKDNGKLRPCTSDFLCKDCIFGINDYPRLSCGDSHKIWANSEYEEYIDWSKVPIDTKILVRGSENEKWKHRHFAGVGQGVDTGCIYAFNFGRTSFTNDDYIVPWKYAKLYKED